MNPIKNTIKSYFYIFFNTILAIIFLIITARITNPSFFGEVSVIQIIESLISSFFIIVNSNIIIDKLTKDYAKGVIDKDYIYNLLSFPFITIPIIFTIPFIFPHYLFFAIPYMILFLFSLYEGSILYGLYRYNITTISGIISSIFRWGFSIIAVIYQNIYLLIFFWTLGTFIQFILQTYEINKILNGIKIKFNKNFIIKMIKDSYIIYINNVLSYISRFGDRIIVIFFLTPYYLGLYQFAVSSSSFLVRMTRPISDNLFQASSYFKALNKNEKKISILSFKIHSYILLLLLILSIIFIKIIIDLFFNQYKSVIYVSVLLFLSVSLSSLFGFLSRFIISFERDKKLFLILTLVNLTSALLISIILIPKYGIIGGAIAQLVSSFLYSISVLYIAVKYDFFEINNDVKKIIFIYSLSLIIPIFLYNELYLSFLFIFSLIYFKILRIFDKKDKDIISRFIPKRWEFMKKIIYIVL